MKSFTKDQNLYSKPNKKEAALLSLRFFLCIFVAGVALFAYIEKQNDLTELRLAIPALEKKFKTVQEENIRLQYEIDTFESPIHLMELARKPEFGHLKYPYVNDVIFLTSRKRPMDEKQVQSP